MRHRYTPQAMRASRFPWTKSGSLYFGEVLHQVPWQFFIGPRFWMEIPLSLSGRAVPKTLTSARSRASHPLCVLWVYGLCATLAPTIFYPTTGTFLQIHIGLFFAQALGSKYTFQSYRLTFNKYGTVRKNQVLAYNLFNCNTGGNPPFTATAFTGTNNELRGYEAGRYLDRYMIATQVEYRVSLPKRFGIAAFGGIGEVIPGGKEIFQNRQLPAQHCAEIPRYELSPKFHLNLRADFARGKDSWTWSMGVGEAF